MALSPSERSRRQRLNMLMAMSYAVAGRSTFTPAALFAAGEQGAWYDPSDFSTMFQDSAGTTPVTAVEQPVGLILDKSKGLALGSELVSNGDFSSATGWTLGAGWTISGDVLNGATGAFSEAWFGLSSVTGATYKVTLTMTRSAGNILVYISNGGNVTLNSSGTFTFYLVAGASGSRISIGGQTFTGTIDNVSVKLIAGNHASQTTSTSRPVLSARVNLLTHSEQFDNAAWVAGPTGVGSVTKSTANAATAPDGMTTADRVIFALNGGTATTDIALLRQTNAATGDLTFSIWAKSYDGTSSYTMQIIRPDGTAQSITVTGTWQRFVATGTATIAVNYGIRLRGGQTTTNSDSADVLLWGADLRSSTAGSSLPPYQRVGASTDYDTTGFPYYLKFDGTDDSMATGTITPGTNKAQVFAGLRKQSDAAFGMIVEGNTAGDGKLYLGNQTSGIYQFYSRGTADAYAAGVTAFPAPSSNVISGLGDISAPFATVRVNGVTRESVSSSQGTGNYAAQPLYIGSRAGSSLRFNGNLYSLIVRFGSNLDATTISNTETWVNGKTGAY